MDGCNDLSIMVWEVRPLYNVIPVPLFVPREMLIADMTFNVEASEEALYLHR